MKRFVKRAVYAWIFGVVNICGELLNMAAFGMYSPVWTIQFMFWWLKKFGQY